MEWGSIRIMDYTTYNGQGYTSIPSSVQTHMKGIIENNIGKDYCCWQGSENVYYMAIGSLKYENGVISGSGTLYTYNYYYNSYGITKGGFNGNVVISGEKNYTYTNTTQSQPAWVGVQAVSFTQISILFSVVFLYILFRDFTMRKRRSGGHVRH